MSTRGLLAGIAALAVGLGWWVGSARDQGAAVAALLSGDDSARLTYDDGSPAWPERESWLRRAGRLIRSRVPGRVKAALGRDYFDRPVQASVQGGGLGGPQGEARDHDLIRRLAKVRSIEILFVDMKVEDADIDQLSRLHAVWWLDLIRSSPELTDAAMPRLAGMRGLECLSILDAPITDRGLAALGQARGLTSLSLGHVGLDPQFAGTIAIKGEGFGHLAHLRSLTMLAIQSPAMTGAGLRYVGRLTHLTELRLDCHSMSDDDLRFLSPLSELERLELVSSSIDGTGFRHLAGLKKLNWVLIHDTKLGDAAVPFLARLPALEHLQITGSRVTATGLEPLGSTGRPLDLRVVPAVTGDINRMIRALPNAQILNGGTNLPSASEVAP